MNWGAIIVQAWLELRPIQRLRQRRMAKKAQQRAEAAAAGGEFFQLDEGTSVNWSLVIALAGSLVRHFLPWATALLAGAGITVTPDASPFLTLALAIAVYAVMQGVSFYRQWRKAK